MRLTEAIASLMGDWNRRRSNLNQKPQTFAEHVAARALEGVEAAVRVGRLDEAPSADARGRPIERRIGSGGADADFLEYLEDMVEGQWLRDCDDADCAVEIETYWHAQNRLRRMFGLRQIPVASLKAALESID